jgi:hypothetical protein
MDPFPGRVERQAVERVGMVQEPAPSADAD